MGEGIVLGIGISDLVNGFMDAIADKVVERLSCREKPIMKLKEVLTIGDVVELTGYKKPTIYKFVSKKEIPFHHPRSGGKKLVFFRTEIESWLKGQREETDEDFISRKRVEIEIGARHGRN